MGGVPKAESPPFRTCFQNSKWSVSALSHFIKPLSFGKGKRGVNFAADDVPDNWNFNGGNPCLHHGGNYNQNQNHGPFYVNYNSASNTNANIGCRLLEANAGQKTCRVWLNLLFGSQGSSPLLYRIVDRAALAEDELSGHSLVHFGPGFAPELPAAMEPL